MHLQAKQNIHLLNYLIILFIFNFFILGIVERRLNPKKPLKNMYEYIKEELLILENIHNIGQEIFR